VVRDQASLSNVRLHDLRRTCVTLLLDLGVPPHVVREIVDHSASEVTMTIYTHVSLGEKRNAMMLGEALKREVVAVKCPFRQ
jgi:integrase